MCICVCVYGWGLVREQQETSGRTKAQQRRLRNLFHGMGVLQLMKAIPVHYLLHMLCCVGIRKPYHQRTREKAGFLGDTDPVKLTITVTSNHRLLEVLKGQSPGLLESADELSPEAAQAQDESGLCLQRCCHTQNSMNSSAGWAGM